MRTLPGFGPDAPQLDPESPFELQQPKVARVPEYGIHHAPVYPHPHAQHPHGQHPHAEIPPPAYEVSPLPPPSIAPPGASGMPMPLEVLAVQDSISPRETLHPWVAVEVFTRNRLYRMNSLLRCVEVVDLQSGQEDLRHDLIGAVLAGGQRKRGGRMEISRPYPWPGSECVFEKREPGKRARFSRTSPVTRVVIRVQVLSVETDNAEPTWHEMTGGR